MAKKEGLIPQLGLMEEGVVSIRRIDTGSQPAGWRPFDPFSCVDGSRSPEEWQFRRPPDVFELLHRHETYATGSKGFSDELAPPTENADRYGGIWNRLELQESLETVSYTTNPAAAAQWTQATDRQTMRWWKSPPEVGFVRFLRGPEQGRGRVDEFPVRVQAAVPRFEVWLDHGFVPPGYAWWWWPNKNLQPWWGGSIRQWLKPREDLSQVSLEVVTHLRAIESSRCDWPRAEIMDLIALRIFLALAALATFCRKVVSRYHETTSTLSAPDQSLLAETAALAEGFSVDERIRLGHAMQKLGAIDFRTGSDARVGRWDPYRPSEVFVADLQLIELVIEEVAEQRHIRGLSEE